MSRSRSACHPEERSDEASVFRKLVQKQIRRFARDDNPVMRNAFAILLAAMLLLLAPRSALAAQLAQDTTSFYKALELESAGKYKEAAPLFRTALNTSSAVS